MTTELSESVHRPGRFGNPTPYVAPLEQDASADACTNIIETFGR